MFDTIKYLIKLKNNGSDVYYDKCIKIEMIYISKNHQMCSMY